MRRYVVIGAVLVMLAVIAPAAAFGSVSGVFWAFTIAVLLVWFAARRNRAPRRRRGAAAPTEPVDDGYY